MKIGRYEVERPLGEGGMASAWLARHPSGDEVVLKIPHILDENTAERVRDEARMGIRLSHPNIVETLDLFEHDGKPVLVVRYVAGCSLKDWWKVGPAPAPAVVRIGAQVTDALAAIHEAKDEHGFPLGILHRDVAPGNILVDRDGNAMLIDLGIARGVESKAQRTALGVIKGTLRYLAPEILEGKPHSVHTDLWALGICLFELALGRAAVRGDEKAVLGAMVRGELFRLRPHEKIEERLSAVLHKLAGPPQERFDSSRHAAEMLARLHEALGDGANIARSFVAASPQADNLGERHAAEEIFPDEPSAPPRPAVTVAAAQDEPAPTIRIAAVDMSTLPSQAPAATVQLTAVNEAVLRAALPTARVAADQILPPPPAEQSGPSPRAITFGLMPVSRPVSSSSADTQPEPEEPEPAWMAPVPDATTAPERQMVHGNPIDLSSFSPPQAAPPGRALAPAMIGALLALALVSAVIVWVMR